MNKFQQTRKDKIFEDLIKELQVISKRGEFRDFGTASTAKGSTNHTLEFDYKGYRCKVELKDK